MASDRRARETQRRVERRVGASATGAAAQEPQTSPNAWIFYGRGHTYGGGGKYAPPGRAAYGASRYGEGATYGEASVEVPEARYGDGFYGRGYYYGSE